MVSLVTSSENHEIQVYYPDVISDNSSATTALPPTLNIPSSSPAVSSTVLPPHNSSIISSIATYNSSTDSSSSPTTPVPTPTTSVTYTSSDESSSIMTPHNSSFSSPTDTLTTSITPVPNLTANLLESLTTHNPSTATNTVVYISINPDSFPLLLIASISVTALLVLIVVIICILAQRRGKKRAYEVQETTCLLTNYKSHV